MALRAARARWVGVGAASVVAPPWRRKVTFQFEVIILVTFIIFPPVLAAWPIPAEVEMPAPE